MTKVLTHPERKLRVALLYGGRSGEHEVSVRSAAAVRSGLDPDKYEVVDFFIDPAGKWHPHPISPEPDGNPGIDVVLPILHGTFGEDGSVQGLLELAGLPYAGAGVLGSSISMDKTMTKRVCREAGLPVVDFIVLRRGEQISELPFGYPVFVKPANLGSSVGITKVKCACDLASAISTASAFDSKIIVERGIVGREFECSVLDGNPPTAAMPCEILPSQDFYSYEDKYLLDAAKVELPPNLHASQIAEMQKLAVGCFEAVCCEGFARVDFLMETSTGRFYVNEINTLPGCTSISMFPKMWEYSGLPFPKLLDRIVELALERARVRAQNRYSR